jgi:hypothetical protein
MKILFVVTVFAIFGMQVGHDHVADTTAKGSGAISSAPSMSMPSVSTPSMPMSMYSSAILSGCDDYHCTKCTTRERCSTDSKCMDPECGHQHATIECHGLPIMYLRASAGFNSCLERAGSIVRTLNSALDIESPELWSFVIEEEAGSVEILLRRKGNGQRRKAVSVTDSDVRGYQLRAEAVPMSYAAKDIDASLVARWWGALLQDHFDAMIVGKTPTRTVETHCGKPLLKAYREARKLVETGRIPMDIWKTVFYTKLSPTDRDRLSVAAQVIPKNFGN